MQIGDKLKEGVAQALDELYGVHVSVDDITISDTRKEFEGEFTIVSFPFTKYSKLKPEETAQVLGEWLKTRLEEVESFNVIKGFLNLSLTNKFWIDYAQDTFGLLERISPLKKEKIMVEYSSPNTNKPLHLGHVRNNLLGYALSNILKAVGHEVTMANLINDRGIHICKSMLAWTDDPTHPTPESTGMKGDHLVGKYYVQYNNVEKDEVAQLMEQGISEDDAKTQTKVLGRAQDMLRKWEDHDPEVHRVWKMMNGWVYDGFKVTYEALGVTFDKYYYESKTYLYGKDLVQEGLKSGAFYQNEDGSIWVDLTEEGLDHKLLLRKDGTSVYITQDLGTAQQRFDEEGLNRLIYVVGNEQEYHFKVLSFIFKKLGRPWWNSLFHFSYGMVVLPQGKMKSREGTVVDADDLIKEMLETAESRTLELGKATDLNPQDAKELYRRVGMAALKFYLLKADPKNKILFNPKDSIDFQGFTGPFLQYTYARIQSLLGKALDTENKGKREGKLKLEKAERELVSLLYGGPQVIYESAREYSPALLANYLYEVAKTFNKFYHECPVLGASDAKVRSLRLDLCRKTANTLLEGNSLLGIEMVDKM